MFLFPLGKAANVGERKNYLAHVTNLGTNFIYLHG